MILQSFSNLTTSLFICQGDFHLKAKIVHIQYFSLYVEGKSYKILIALDILNSNYQLRFINSLFCLLFSNLLQLMINITFTKYILVSLINENPRCPLVYPWLSFPLYKSQKSTVYYYLWDGTEGL